jgi:hypothetical protein
MRTRGSSITAMAVWLALAVTPVFGQFSDQYRQAAQAYSNAAAQCQNPAGAACMRTNAQYYNCLSNDLSGRSCGGSPTCSTSCTGAGSGTGTGTPSMGTSATGNPKLDNINNAITGAFKIWSILHPPKSDAGGEDPLPAQPVPEEAAQAQLAQRQADAANLLSDSNVLLGAMNGGAGSAGSTSTAPNLDSLFDNGAPSSASTSAINSLLGDPSTAADSPANAVADLLGDSPSPTAIDDQQTSLSAVQTAMVPQDSQTRAVFDESEDSPQPLDVSSSAPNLLDALRQKVHDALTGLTDTVKTTATSIVDKINDPALNCLAYGGTTKEGAGNPNLAVDNAARCGSLKLLIPGPYPVTQDAAAASYMLGIQNAAGLSTLGMSTGDDSQ